MRKSILLAIASAMSLIANAQCELPYKPLAEFGTDTTGFLMYNFRERGDCYVDKTVAGFLQDLALPVNNFTLLVDKSNPDEVQGITINLYDEKALGSRIKQKNEPHNIKIYFDVPFRKSRLESFSRNNSVHKEWNDEAKQFFRNMLIYATRTNVFSFSKYYKKFASGKR